MNRRTGEKPDAHAKETRNTCLDRGRCRLRAGSDRGGSAAVADSGTATAARPCASSAPTHIPQPTSRELAAAGLKGLPLAPKRKRVDLVAPRFSNAANVTNPLFPISKLHSAILNGKVSGKVFRVETTLLPDTRIIEWKNGKCVRTLVSQSATMSPRRRSHRHRTSKDARCHSPAPMTIPAMPMREVRRARSG